MKRATDLPRTTREMVLEAKKLTAPEARYLVSNYYAAQDMRKRADMQRRHAPSTEGVGEGDVAAVVEDRVTALGYMADGFAYMETQIQRMLEHYAKSSLVGEWMLAQYGVGPVISAGLLAHLDVTKADTAGHFWRFAGLDPTSKWEKGQKRPWNPDVKQLCFHFGECVKRTSGSEKSYYGKIYRDRKALLIVRNERGDFAERAKTFFTKSKEWQAILDTGKLPPGNLDRQACRFAAKMFLSHLHAVMYWCHYHRAPPKPFAIAIQGHAHEVRVPLTEMLPGFSEAYYGAAAA